MSRGHWRIVASLVGLICLSLGSYAGYQLYDAAHQRDASYDYQPAADARFPVMMEGQPKPAEYQPNCKQPNSREDADLCAQWAAVAQVTEANRLASFSLQLSIGALIFTIIGTGLLVWTLWETRATARRELRAYVSVKITSVIVTEVPEGLVFKFMIVCHNGGTTPAYKCVHFGTTSVFTDTEAAETLKVVKPIDSGELQDGSVIHAGDDFPVEMNNPVLVPTSLINEIRAGKCSIYTYGATSYLDTFGIRRRTDYCYQMDSGVFAKAVEAGRNGGDGKTFRMKWSIPSFHNSAT
jgi:hypothetical protein